MSSRTVTVRMPVEFTRDGLRAAVMGAGWETQDWRTAVHYENGTGDKECTLVVASRQPGEENTEPGRRVTARVTLDVVVAALAEFEYRPEDKAGLGSRHVEPVSRDCVIQQIVYREVEFG